MKNQAESLFKNKCKFEVSLRYELFYSLNTLLDPASRIHTQWRAQSMKRLGSNFERKLTEVGKSWEIWNVLPALLPGQVSSPSFEEIIEGLKRLPLSEFQEKILTGMLHSEDVVQAVLSNKSSLKAAMAKVPKVKREWLEHIGLYPFNSTSPHVVALEKLLQHPQKFRKSVLEILELYWEKVFQVVWQQMHSQYKRSVQERERLFLSCSFSEFAKQALIRIEVNEKKGQITAMRGGYQLSIGDIEACYFVPSAFNDRRFWSAFAEEDKKTTVYFPCFDPSITLDLQVAKEYRGSEFVEPSLDPALIFKALGDTTRFAMASILARSSKSSVELAKLLSVSKPTISHHVHLLREAGLIQETYINGSVELQLKRSVIESLSELAVKKFFAADTKPSLTRTRGGVVS